MSCYKLERGKQVDNWIGFVYHFFCGSVQHYKTDVKLHNRRFVLTDFQMNYTIDVFLDRAIIKNFQNIFSTSLNCHYNLIYLPSS